MILLSYLREIDQPPQVDGLRKLGAPIENRANESENRGPAIEALQAGDHTRIFHSIPPEFPHIIYLRGIKAKRTTGPRRTPPVSCLRLVNHLLAQCSSSWLLLISFDLGAISGLHHPRTSVVIRS